MHFFQRLNAKAFALLAAVAGSAIGFAQFTPPPAPTQAWHDVIPAPSGASNQSVKSCGVDVDASGNVYALYVNETSGGPQAHLMKRGPANPLLWDVTVSNDAHYSAFAVLVSPRISGTQYVYVVGWSNSGIGNAPVPILVNKYDTSGNDQWGRSIPLSNMLQNTPVGAYADASGDLYVAAETNQDNGTDRSLSLFDLDPLGGWSAVVNRSIKPQFANYDPTSSSWFVTGFSPTSVPNTMAVWGSFDRGTGYLNFGGSSADSFDGTFLTGVSYTINMLPGGHFALVWNRDVSEPMGTTPDVLDCQFRVFDTQYNTIFTYPGGSATVPGNIDQVAAYSTSSPIFVAGHDSTATSGHPKQYLERYDWSGNRTFHNPEQPIGTIFAVADGFYDLFNWEDSQCCFLEHYYDSGSSFNWGKQLPLNLGTPFPTLLKRFQNSFYVLLANYPNLYLDRYVEGTCLSSVSLPSSFPAGSSVAVNIILNQPVPTGQTVTVSLYSSSANVTMPNGQRSQAFTLAAGQQLQGVTLTTANVGSSYGFTIQGLQNGIYRYAAAVAH